MKRSIVAICVVVVSVCITGPIGCTREVPQSQEQAAQSDWTLPPTVETAQRQGASLLIRGEAAPAGRVVLRGGGSTAYAVSADEEGQFEVRIASPQTDTLFVVETQKGQVGLPSPYRLLVSADRSGPIALVGSGVASRRLDPASDLDSVDSDGRALIVSGRTLANREFDLTWNGETRTVRAGTNGRWSALLSVAGDQESTAIIDGQTFAVPVMGTAVSARPLVREGAGWRLTWSVSPGIMQSSWFPDQRQ